MAILAVITIPDLKEKESSAARLRLPNKRASEVLENLQRMGLVSFAKGQNSTATARTLLAKESPLIRQYHSNWRLRALNSIENQNENDLHYSSLVTLSKKDVEAVKSCLIRSLEEIAKIIARSTEQQLCSLNIDFFEI